MARRAGRVSGVERASFADCAGRCCACAVQAGAWGGVLPASFMVLLGFVLAAANRHCISRSASANWACARLV